MSDLPSDPGSAGDDLDLDLGLGDPAAEIDQDPPAEELEAEAPEVNPPEDDEQQQPERQPRRGESARWRERYERDIGELRQRLDQQQPQRQQPQVDPAAVQRAQAEEIERLRLMDPVEAMLYLRNQANQQMQQALLYQQLNTQDQIDRRDFDSASRTSKIHQHYKAEVERTLAAERAAGNLVATRAAILERLVGRDALARSGRVAPGQRNRAGQRVAAQTVRPGSATRGEVARGNRGRDQGSEDERLLRGTAVGDI